MDVTRFVVNSADRDLQAHPTPASYVVHMPSDTFNVCSIKLVSAIMPKKLAYVVSAGEAQRVSLVQSTAQAATATLPPGDYTSASDVAAAMGVALNAASASNQFAVSVDTRLDRLVIRSTAQFSIDASRMHPATVQVLGLAAGRPQAAAFDDDGSGFPWVLNVPHCVCLDAQYRSSAVLRLRLPSTELLKSASQTLDRAFAILSPGPNNMDVSCAYKKQWTVPVSRLSRFHVEFVDLFGEPYDFQNQDHRLEFLVESMPCGPSV